MRTLAATILLTLSSIALAADTVPTDIQQPGTQPGEIGNLESPDITAATTVPSSLPITGAAR
jgi:hypothetical protein